MMKCGNCGYDNYKIVDTQPNYKRIECYKCNFRSNIYNDAVSEMKSCIDAVNSGISLEDFLFNANKEKE